MANDDETPAAKPEKPKKEAAKGKGGGGKDKKGKEPTGPAPTYKREQPPRLKRLFNETVKSNMMKEFGYTSEMQVPRVVKITLNMGLGRATQDAKILDSAVEEIKAITGQSPVICKAKKD